MTKPSEPATPEPTPFERFTRAILAVPKQALDEQEAAYQREQAAKPLRRGPKPGSKRAGNPVN